MPVEHHITITSTKWTKKQLYTVHSGYFTHISIHIPDFKMFPNVILQFLCRCLKTRRKVSSWISSFEVSCSSDRYQRPVFMLIIVYYKFQHFDEAEKKKNLSCSSTLPLIACRICTKRSSQCNGKGLSSWMDCFAGVKRTLLIEMHWPEHGVSNGRKMTRH